MIYFFLLYMSNKRKIMIKNGRGEKLEGTGIIKDVFNYVKG